MLWIYPKLYKGFHYCSIGIVYMVVLISTLPYCAKVLSHLFLHVNRDVRGGSDLSQIASTASGGTNISQAPGCGEVPESWLLLLFKDHISYCSAVSFSFCSVHIINNNTTTEEYFKRWLLLLSSIPMNNTDGYWDKSVLSVCVCVSRPRPPSPRIFLSSIFLFLNINHIWPFYSM